MPAFLYSRTSTDRQETANQLHSMRQRYPDAEVVEEIASGAKARPELDVLIAKLQGGDTLVVWSLDRLGRRCGELVQLLEDLNRKGIVLVSLREGIDLGSLAGRFTAQIFAALAELERGLISTRTKAALAAKREAGQRLGRPQVIAPHVYAEVDRLATEGVRVMEISRRLGLPPSTVSKRIRVHKKRAKRLQTRNAHCGAQHLYQM